jgi:hypothetical protein
VVAAVAADGEGEVGGGVGCFLQLAATKASKTINEYKEPCVLMSINAFPPNCRVWLPLSDLALQRFVNDYSAKQKTAK